jgi:hypothetical protein
MPTYYVLSARGITPSPAQCCVNEFEDIIASACNAKLLVPINSGRFNPDLSAPAKDRVLLVVCISVFQAPLLLRLIPRWRDEFGKVAVYVFDAYPTNNNSRPWWKPAWASGTLSALRTVDAFFVGMLGGVDYVSRLTGMPARFVPLGANVADFGSGGSERWIDVNAYGRQYEPHRRALADRFNQKERSTFFFHTAHMQVSGVPDYLRHRAQFWQMLRMSKLMLAYDPMFANRKGGSAQFTFSFLGQRWFEGLCAGCLVVGRRPTCVEADSLLDWEDATVELPADTAEAVDFVEDLLEDGDRLRFAQIRNYGHSLLKHDWRHRLIEILDALGEDPPVLLQGQAATARQLGLQVLDDI